MGVRYFIYFLSKIVIKKRIYNTEVIDELKMEIERLKNL